MNEEIINNELAITSSLHLKTMEQSNVIQNMVRVIKKCHNSGGKVLLFGNGGSAADAQHIAAELIGRFKKNRKPLRAISFTTDTSIITAVGNDFGFDDVFSRQCEALVDKGDVIIAISTSGNSKNVIKGVKVARSKGGIVLGLTGHAGGSLKNYCDYILKAPSDDTAKIQEIHRTVGHIVCRLLEM